MYQEIIDPPEDFWPEDHKDLSWLDDLARDEANEYYDNEAAALHAFECRIYGEPHRRYVV